MRREDFIYWSQQDEMIDSPSGIQEADEVEGRVLLCGWLCQTQGKPQGRRSFVTMYLLGGAIGCCRSWHVSVLEALLLNAILSDL